LEYQYIGIETHEYGKYNNWNYNAQEQGHTYILIGKPNAHGKAEICTRMWRYKCIVIRKHKCTWRER